jgi:hypothetical protein
MGIDHGGFDILVAQQFLDGADIVMVFQQVRGEAMPEGMARYTLVETGGARCSPLSSR